MLVLSFLQERRIIMYSVKILADSFALSGKRLTTFELTYPRFVHAELMTHRSFSRNSASSRAIPNEKLRERIQNDPALPIWWGKNQSGMQAREELQMPELFDVQQKWLEARDVMLKYSEELSKLGLHKQITNRIIEPWMFITVIVSATEYSNWFHLRCHPDAQPEIKWVADEMKKQYDTHKPQEIQSGDWHLPLINDEDRIEMDKVLRERYKFLKQEFLGDEFDWHLKIQKELCKVSVGRCARVSYLTHDGKRDLNKDIELHNRLMTSGHWSPFEHVAQALDKPEWHGNFCGWKQFRKNYGNEAGGGVSR